jgi:cell fate regulator YaaT (PSP1 superfamily)
MPDIVGIRFRKCGKIYDFQVDGMEVKQGDAVIVESEFGLGIGKVVKGRRTVDESPQQLKKVIRLVTDEDLRAKEENGRLENEARSFCSERIMARGLPMKLIGAEATLDRRRIILYFTADGRIDFRELVKDLAARFKTRIEMRQIGVRDEAKSIGGFGICGREVCCTTFLTSFEPISIKMAKKQELVLNVGKLSGVCGRLMCCLRYEYEGDVGTIASDDEIPLGDEESPIEVVEEKMSMTEVKGRGTAEGKVIPAPRRSTAETAAIPGAPRGEEKAEEGEKPRARRKGKRRRFKK